MLGAALAQVALDTYKVARDFEKCVREEESGKTPVVLVVSQMKVLLESFNLRIPDISTYLGSVSLCKLKRDRNEHLRSRNERR